MGHLLNNTHMLRPDTPGLSAHSPTPSHLPHHRPPTHTSLQDLAPHHEMAAFCCGSCAEAWGFWRPAHARGSGHCRRPSCGTHLGGAEAGQETVPRGFHGEKSIQAALGGGIKEVWRIPAALQWTCPPITPPRAGPGMLGDLA